MTKRRMLKIAAAVLLVSSLSFFAFRITKMAIEKSEASERIKMLPDFKFYTLDEKKFTNLDMAPGKQALIIFFSPDCDHCQSEAQELQHHLALFEGTQVLMITDKSRQEVLAFAEQYKLKGTPVTFLLDKEDNFYKTFGKTGFPICFMYSTDHKLLKVYEGETKAEAIQKVFEMKS